jgi:hypothetical protein
MTTPNSPLPEHELLNTFICQRLDGTTYTVRTAEEYLAAVREFLNGELRGIYPDADNAPEPS